MALQKGTLNGIPILEDDSAVGVPITDVSGDGGDIAAAAAGFLATKRSQFVVDTVADLLTLDSKYRIDGQTYRTLRYSTAHKVGDGSGNIYRYRSAGRGEISEDLGFFINGPETFDYFEAVDRSVAHLKSFGAVGDEGTNEASAILSWIAAVMGGAKGRVTKGTYSVPTGWTEIATTGNVLVECEDGVVFKSVDTLDFMALTAGHSLKWSGGEFNTWRNVFELGTGSHEKVSISGVKADGYARFVNAQSAIDAVKSLKVLDCELLNGTEFGILNRCNRLEVCQISRNRIVGIASADGSAMAIAIAGSTTATNVDDAFHGAVEISNNYIKDITSAVVDEVHGILAVGRHVDVRNNYIENVSANAGAGGSDDEAIYTKASFSEISNNIIVDAGFGEGCIIAKGIDRALGADVSMSLGEGGFASKITGNTVLSSTDVSRHAGINANCSDTLVFGNHIYGIFRSILANRDRVQVKSNDIYAYQGGSTCIGVDISSSDNAEVYDNRFWEVGKAASANAWLVRINGDCDGVKVCRNTGRAQGGNTYGVALASGVKQNITIRDNSFLGLDFGVHWSGAGSVADIQVDKNDYPGLNPNGGHLTTNLKQIANSETISAAAPVIGRRYETTNLDASSNSVAATLGDGEYLAEKKLIRMVDGTNASTVTVANHELGVDQAFNFNAANEYLLLSWTGDFWVTVGTNT